MKQKVRLTSIYYIGFSIVVFSSLILYVYLDFLRFTNDTLSYYKIQISDNIDDVRYKLGYPRFVSTAKRTIDGSESAEIFRTSNVDINRRDIPAGMTVSDFRSWFHNIGGDNIAITFDYNERVSSIQCFNIVRDDCDTVYGLRLRDKESAVVSRLGSDAYVTFNGNKKALTYQRIGVTIWLDRDGVSGFDISKTDKIPFYDLMWLYISGASLFFR